MGGTYDMTIHPKPGGEYVIAVDDEVIRDAVTAYRKKTRSR